MAQSNTRFISLLLKKRVWKFILLVVTFIAAVWQVENWRGRKRWEAVLETINQRGESLNYQDFAIYLPPDEENAMRHPFFEKALKDEKIPFFDPSACWKAAYQNVPRELLENAFTSLTHWQEVLRQDPSRDWSETDGSSSSDVLWATSDFEKVEEALHEAFKRPHSVWAAARKHADDLPLVPQIPNILPSYVDLTRIVQARVIALLENGNPDKALRSLNVALSLATSVQEEGSLVSSMVTQALTVPCQELVEAVLFHPGWRSENLYQIQRTLERTDLIAGLYRGHERERASTAFYLTSLISGKSDPFLHGNVFWGNVHRMPKGLFYQNLANYLEWFDQGFLGWFDRETRRVRLNDRFRPSQKRTPYTFLALLAFPQLTDFAPNCTATQTKQDLLRIACSWLRYRQENGSNPETLQVLEPDFIAAIPHDYLTGERPHVTTLSNGSFQLSASPWEGSPLSMLEIPVR